MTDQKHGWDKLQELFGPTIPIEAMAFTGTLSDETTYDDIRKYLTGMAFLWKSLNKRDSLLEPHAIHHIFQQQGTVVTRTGDNKPLFVAQSDMQAAQLVLLLNLGHVEFVKEYHKNPSAFPGI